MSSGRLACGRLAQNAEARMYAGQVQGTPPGLLLGKVILAI
jgi:hypothetical protein